MGPDPRSGHFPVPLRVHGEHGQILSPAPEGQEDLPLVPVALAEQAAADPFVLLPSLAEHPAAAALLGGCFVGLGVGLAVRAGGAAGGDDALAMTISHVTKWPISRAYLFTDLVVLALSATYISPKNLLCSLITVTVSSFLIGRVQTFGKKEPSGGVPLAVK